MPSGNPLVCFRLPSGMWVFEALQMLDFLTIRKLQQHPSKILSRGFERTSHINIKISHIYWMSASVHIFGLWWLVATVEDIDIHADTGIETATPITGIMSVSLSLTMSCAHWLDTDFVFKHFPEAVGLTSKERTSLYSRKPCGLPPSAVSIRPGRAASVAVW